jgi:hypothetical protein
MVEPLTVEAMLGGMNLSENESSSLSKASKAINRLTLPPIRFDSCLYLVRQLDMAGEISKL